MNVVFKQPENVTGPSKISDTQEFTKLFGIKYKILNKMAPPRKYETNVGGGKRLSDEK